MEFTINILETHRRILEDSKSGLTSIYNPTLIRVYNEQISELDKAISILKAGNKNKR